MSSKTFNFLETGNCWRLEDTEIFLHVPFLKNSSDKYLKRIFKSDFGLNLSDHNIGSLRNTKNKTVTVECLEDDATT